MSAIVHGASRLTEFELALDAGHVDDVIKRRSELLEAVTDEPHDSMVGALGRAMAADLHLIMHEQRTGLDALGPYLDGSGSKVSRAAIEHVRGKLSRAAVLSACSNALYHNGFFDGAHEAAIDACRRFESLYRQAEHREEVGEGTSQPASIGFLWTVAYSARIAWRNSAHWLQAERYLAQCQRELEKVRHADSVTQARLSTLEIFLTDLRSHICWRLNRIPEAEAASFRSLLAAQTLSEVSGIDSARTAHAYLQAGRVQSTLASPDRYWMAERFLRTAISLFGAIAHPLRWLARMELARLLAKVGRAEEAETELEDREFPKDHAALSAERELTRCWIYQRRKQAKFQIAHLAAAREVVAKATMHSLSRTLTMEGRLHIGMALAASANRDEWRNAVGELAEVLRQAEDLGRERLAAACLLELAAVQSKLGEDLSVKANLDRVAAMLPRIASEYLRRRWNQLKGGLVVRWFHTVETIKHTAAQEQFNIDFFAKAKAAFGDVAAIAERTGAARETVRKYLDMAPKGASQGTSSDNSTDAAGQVALEAKGARIASSTEGTAEADAADLRSRQQIAKPRSSRSRAARNRPTVDKT